MEWLTVLWFILIAVLWTGYLTLEGFDLGVGMLLRILGKNDRERTLMVKTIGPHWDGNEVWLLTAGGATFAAFPAWYATMFSGMYLALLLILLALIVRICAIEWRKQIDSERWRSFWDTAHTVSAWLPPILFGCAFANLVQGMSVEIVARNAPMVGVAPEDIDMSLQVHNLTGGFFSLLSPFTLLGGLVVAAIFLSHGALFLTLKTTGDFEKRCASATKILTLAATGLTAVWALWAQFAYSNQIWSWLPLVIAALAAIASSAGIYLNKYGTSFILNFVTIAAAVAFIFTAMAPYVMKSSISAVYSLTMWEASSSEATLTVMTIVAALFVPVVLVYTLWSYWVFRSRIRLDSVTSGAGILPKKIRPKANFLRG